MSAKHIDSEIIGENGDTFPVRYDDESAVGKAIQAAIDDAEYRLPSGTVYEIRGKSHPADHRATPWGAARTRDEMAEAWGVAWYTTYAIQAHRGALFQEGSHKTAHDPRDGVCGYILIGRRIAE